MSQIKQGFSLNYKINSINTILPNKKRPNKTGTGFYPANVSFRSFLVDVKIDDELGMQETEVNFNFVISCDDMSLIPLLEVIRYMRDSNQSFDLLGSTPKYGDFKSVYTVNSLMSGEEFLAKYKVVKK